MVSEELEDQQATHYPSMKKGQFHAAQKTRCIRAVSQQEEEAFEYHEVRSVAGVSDINGIPDQKCQFRITANALTRLKADVSWLPRSPGWNPPTNWPAGVACGTLLAVLVKP